ncbi:tannase/feruloyl esterase family alpha/beta hydrolase [Streptomyces sp. NPDC053499]|uniref:tannase/feruloyl esterase family alpha/beta hydrolase n=1 Tax=Streptomyces sp. NPDC053499 TaxID=3365707 RepID=UPI0037CDA85E
MRRRTATVAMVAATLVAVTMTPTAPGATADGTSSTSSKSSKSGTSGAAACTDLRGLDIPRARIGLPTRGGTVTSAQPVPPSGEGAAALVPYCRVDAEIHPVDRAAPAIRLRLALPDREHWNHRAMMLGGGGYNGSIPDVTGNVPFAPAGKRTPLGRGYAVFASDSGHQTPPDHKPTPSLDGSFGTNDEALRNFAGDALKKTRDAALFVLGEHYAGQQPRRSFFAGGSTGGREALAVAQRWPRDFDGVLAVYPAWNAASLDLFFGYAARLLSRPGAFPGPAQQRLLHRAVLDACDGDDGLRDGVVSDEAGCRFDPRTLRCPEDTVSGTDQADSRTGAPPCLSGRQIRTVEALSSPLRWKYPLGSGERGYPGFPFLSGADMTTPLLGMGSTAPANPMPLDSGYGVQFWEQWVRYFVTRDPGFDSLSLDPRHPGRWRHRVSELAALQDVNDPDLRPFARAGGKLLLLHGTADELVSHRSTVEYFQRVRKVMGKRATERFARFYLVPGANHANVAPAFAAGWDSVGALEKWTEHGRAPHRPVVTDTGPGADGRTRPLCAYPEWPRYDGSGDPDEARNFTCHR